MSLTPRSGSLSPMGPERFHEAGSPRSWQCGSHPDFHRKRDSQREARDSMPVSLLSSTLFYGQAFRGIVEVASRKACLQKR